MFIVYRIERRQEPERLKGFSADNKDAAKEYAQKQEGRIVVLRWENGRYLGVEPHAPEPESEDGQDEN